MFLPSPNTNIGKMALAFCGPWIWNKVPLFMRNYTHFITFKKEVKSYSLTLQNIELL